MKDSELDFDRERHLIYPRSYKKKVRRWLKHRYSAQAEGIWEQTQINYADILRDEPYYGGKDAGHVFSIYGAALIFALYRALPDKPPVSELQDFCYDLFMSPFRRLGMIIDLNKRSHMRLIDTVFKKSGENDRKKIVLYPDGFVNVSEPYDADRQISRYHFLQCPVAEMAKRLDMVNVLPLMCNCDYYGIEQIKGTLIRKQTCGFGDLCDYCVVGNRNPLSDEYVKTVNEGGFIVSIPKER